MKPRRGELDARTTDRMGRTGHLKEEIEMYSRGGGVGIVGVIIIVLVILWLVHVI